MTSVGDIPRTGSQAEAAGQRAGVVAALIAYAMWGFLPLLFYFLRDAGAMTIVADRTVWSLVLVGAILLVRGRLAEVRAIFTNGRALWGMALSSLLLGGNWLLYVYAVESGQVLEASFGYFINPLINIAIGMVFLGERQNRWQTVAIAIAVVAIVIQSVGMGGVPFIALGLATSFAFYGYFRKIAAVSSTIGLFVETLMILPLALGYLTYTFIVSGPGVHADPVQMGLLIATGPATALPLLAFAFAIRRLRMTTIGMFQYVAPSLQFLLAITFFQEELNALRLVSFVMIWLSLVVFSLDSWRRHSAGTLA